MTDIDYRARAAEALAQGEPERAARWLARLLESAPTAANAGYVNSRFAELSTRLQLPVLKVAVLRSFTVEPLVPLVQARCYAAGLRTEWLVGGFNAYVQEILDASSELYRFEPHVIFLAVRAGDLSPALTRDVAGLDREGRVAETAAAVGRLEQLLAQLRSKTSATIVVHNFEQEPYPAGGVLDAQSAFSQRDAIAAINRGLVEAARTHSGVYVLDYSELVARFGRLGWTDNFKRLTMSLPLSSSSLNHLADEYTRYLRPLSGKVCKAVAVDFDNTLWGGVIGEDGIDGIRLGPEYPGSAHLELQRALLDLQARGILICACSKNNAAEAMAVLEQHPAMLLRPDRFAALEINWDDKAVNLRRIAAALDIGLDAIAFLDDNPSEREWVREQVPDVHVLELPRDVVGYAEAVRSSPLFERLSLSDEDRVRTRQYAEQRQRARVAGSAGSLEEFLSSLQMVATFRDLDRQTLPRVSQLTLKTNQFNLTTRRYPEAELAGLGNDPAITVRSLQLEDRFGDNGIVGVLITRARQDAWEIDTLLLSCRVIGRTAETAMLADAAGRARAAGARWLEGWCIPTAKNVPARDCYERHGFVRIEERNDAILWRLDLTATSIDPPRCIATRVMDGGAKV
jgi:FkbH-like protein